MNADLGPYGVWIAIAAMAVVTYAIRAGGFWLMGYVPLTQRVRSILNALPGSVIAAIIVPLAVRGGTAAAAAVVTALVVMAFRRNDLLAVVCGIGAAVLVRGFSL
jgi:branched chain amino acid efflux pump